jgi:hypothetical protein
MQYEVVFDVATAGYREWWVPFWGLFFIGLGWLLAQSRQRGEPHATVRSGILPRVFYTLGVFWVCGTFALTCGHYWHLRHLLHTGRYEVVEGRVTQFTPEPWGGMETRVLSSTIGGLPTQAPWGRGDSTRRIFFEDRSARASMFVSHTLEM